MKWPSIQLRVKSFGTARTKSSSLSSSPSTWSNHVRYVVSLRAPLSRPDTSLHRPSAVSSIGGSTPPDALLLEGQASAEHSSVRAASQCVLRPLRGGRKAGDLQGKRCPPHHRPQVWTVLPGEATLSAMRPCSERLFRPRSNARLLWRTTPSRLVYTFSDPARTRAVFHTLS